jgi:hypothetical protein
MMNAMAGLPAALGGQLGMGMSHQALSHQLSQLRLGPFKFSNFRTRTFSSFHDQLVGTRRSAFGISGGRSRMPDAHVEMLLDCYKLVQEERTLDSGRLGKGAFHQVQNNFNPTRK